MPLGQWFQGTSSPTKLPFFLALTPQNSVPPAAFYHFQFSGQLNIYGFRLILDTWETNAASKDKETKITAEIHAGSGTRCERKSRQEGLLPRGQIEPPQPNNFPNSEPCSHTLHSETSDFFSTVDSIHIPAVMSDRTRSISFTDIVLKEKYNHVSALTASRKQIMETTP